MEGAIDALQNRAAVTLNTGTIMNLQGELNKLLEQLSDTLTQLRDEQGFTAYFEIPALPSRLGVDFDKRDENDARVTPEGRLLVRGILWCLRSQRPRNGGVAKTIALKTICYEQLCTMHSKKKCILCSSNRMQMHEVLLVSYRAVHVISGV